MNTQSNVLSEPFDAPRAAQTVMSPTHPFFWSIRRELMENRWIYRAQLAVAAVYLLGYVFKLHQFPTAMAEFFARHQREAITAPYDIAAAVMMATLILMSLFYSADALHGERRDRSILFWKSLPVSDRTTVLAKASILLLVLPLLTFAVTVVLQILILLLNVVALAANGYSIALVWAQLGMFQFWGQLLYHLMAAHALWPFPVFCWVMLVSGWARRAVLLWAALPIVAIGALEKLVFNSTHFIEMTAVRLIGGGAPTDITSGQMMPFGPMAHLTPLRYLSSPALWIGFLLAAVFLAAAVQLRRYQGPI